MRWLVSISFVPGQEAARATLLPAEQAHVKELMEDGVVEAGYLSADRTRSASEQTAGPQILAGQSSMEGRCAIPSPIPARDRARQT